jgi:hypothetical protein
MAHKVKENAVKDVIQQQTVGYRSLIVAIKDINRWEQDLLDVIDCSKYKIFVPYKQWTKNSFIMAEKTQ